MTKFSGLKLCLPGPLHLAPSNVRDDCPVGIDEGDRSREVHVEGAVLNKECPVMPRAGGFKPVCRGSRCRAALFIAATNFHLPLVEEIFTWTGVDMGVK